MVIYIWFYIGYIRSPHPEFIVAGLKGCRDLILATQFVQKWRIS